MNILIKNKTTDFIPLPWNGKIQNFIIPNDGDYLKYIYENNGGYYFNNSIHVYGFTSNSKFHDIVYLNTLIKNKYKNLFHGISFAEDLFGNLFSFTNQGIIFFEIETGDSEVISKNFADWCEMIDEEIDFYGGVNLLEELRDNNLIQSLSQGYRLAPKMPFILQGEYQINNLILKPFEDNIVFNAALAKQINNIPDGTDFKINIENLDF